MAVATRHCFTSTQSKARSLVGEWVSPAFGRWYVVSVGCSCPILKGFVLEIDDRKPSGTYQCRIGTPGMEWAAQHIEIEIMLEGIR